MSTAGSRLIPCLLFALSITACGGEPAASGEPGQEVEDAPPAPAREALLWDGLEGQQCAEVPELHHVPSRLRHGLFRMARHGGGAAVCECVQWG